MSVEVLLGIIIFLLIFLTYFVWELWQVYKDLTIKQLNLSREAEKVRMEQLGLLRSIDQHNLEIRKHFYPNKFL